MTKTGWRPYHCRKFIPVANSWWPKKNQISLLKKNSLKLKTKKRKKTKPFLSLELVNYHNSWSTSEYEVELQIVHHVINSLWVCSWLPLACCWFLCCFHGWVYKKGFWFPEKPWISECELESTIVCERSWWRSEPREQGRYTKSWEEWELCLPPSSSFFLIVYFLFWDMFYQLIQFELLTTYMELFSFWFLANGIH